MFFYATIFPHNEEKLILLCTGSTHLCIRPFICLHKSSSEDKTDKRKLLEAQKKTKCGLFLLTEGLKPPPSLFILFPRVLSSLLPQVCLIASPP